MLRQHTGGEAVNISWNRNRVLGGNRVLKYGYSCIKLSSTGHDQAEAPWIVLIAIAEPIE